MTRQTSPGEDLEYDFPSTDNDGRLWKKKDWLSGEEVTYQYDEIGRLRAAATTGPEWGLSWTFDGFGNRLAQTVTKGSAPASSVSVNAATNRVVGLGYDNNGNQTSWTTPLGPVTAAYDVDNRLASISTPNGSEVYASSAANQRLRKQGKLYFYGVGGELLMTFDFAFGGSGAIPQNPKSLVYFGGMLVFGEGDRRMTMDRLGSTVRTEGNGQPELRFRYYPYGEQQGGSAQDEQVKFGTYWRDSVSGLDYAQNRYFAATQGRFTSADPYVMSGGMGSPQGWNRYAYVSGDPIGYLDPQGLQSCPAPCFSITHEEKITQGPGIQGNSDRGVWGPGNGADVAEYWMGDGEGYSVYGGTVAPVEPLQVESCSLAQLIANDDCGMQSRPWLAAAVRSNRWVRYGAVAWWAAARAIGTSGENVISKLLQLPKNNDFSITYGMRTRMPDFVNRGMRAIFEVKNFSSLNWTQQLDDMANWAEQEGYSFTLYVRNGAGLSRNVLQAEIDGKVIIRYFQWP